MRPLGDGLEYFKGIVIGNVQDWDKFTIAVWEEQDRHIRPNVPEDSELARLRNKKPILIISITMYNESFDQFLQTFASAVRHIAEMYHIDKSEYEDRIIVILI